MLFNPQRILCIATLALFACDSPETRAFDREPAELASFETVRIGAVETPDQMLTTVGAILPDASGGAWILQPQDADIKVFASDGKRIQTIGGRGDGPGQFAYPVRMGPWGPAGDSIWVLDFVHRRLSVFTGDGRLGRTVPVGEADMHGSWKVSLPSAFTQSGDALSLGSQAESPASAVFRYDVTGKGAAVQLGSVARTPVVDITSGNRKLATAVHPLSDAPIVGFSMDRFYIMRRSGALGEFSVTAIDIEGDTAWTRAYRRQGVAVPESVRDSLYTAGVASFQRFTRIEKVVSDEEAAGAYRTSIVIPDNYPGAKDLLTGLDGTLFVSFHSASDSILWWQLSDNGEVEGQFRVPRGMTLHAGNAGSVWGVSRDSLDIPHVVRLQLKAK